MMTNADVPDKLESLIKYHDSPIATITYFVHSLLIRKIREDGIRVVISGTGADELFTLYYDDFLLHLHTHLHLHLHGDLHVQLDNIHICVYIYIY